MRVEVGTDDASRRDEVRVAGDGASDPVDVRGFEGGDFTERMTPELAEPDLVGARLLERRRLRRSEAADARAAERPGRFGRSGRLALHRLRTGRRLAGRMAAARETGRCLIARPERVARVEPGRHRPPRSRSRRPRARTSSTRARGAGARGAGRSSGRLAGGPGTREPPSHNLLGPASELLVGRVDLGHPPCGGPGRDRIGDRQVGVVFAGQPPPGRLDRRRAGARRDTQDLAGIASWHSSSLPVPSVTTGPQPRARRATPPPLTARPRGTHGTPSRDAVALPAALALPAFLVNVRTGNTTQRSGPPGSAAKRSAASSAPPESRCCAARRHRRGLAGVRGPGPSLVRHRRPARGGQRSEAAH